MKIVYAIHHLPPRYTGGAEYRALRTARWMITHRQHVSMIAVEAIDQAEPPYQDSREDDLLLRRLFFDHRNLGPQRRWTFDNDWIEQQVGEFLDAQQPDLFHLFSGYLMTAAAIRAARLRHIPIVISLTDFWFLCPRITLLRSDGAVCPAPPSDPLGCVRCLAEEQRRYRWLAQGAPAVADRFWSSIAPARPRFKREADHIRDRRETLGQALTHADALISPSRFLCDKLIESGVAPDKFHVMRQGLAAPLAPAAPRKSDAPFSIAYLGQIKSHKGVDLLIDAALTLRARGQRFTLAIYGNDSEDRAFSDPLKQRTQDIDAIEWRGVCSRDEVWQVLSSSDVVVVPSRWYENSPNIILEAQAARVPVITTRLGGMAELVEHEVNGLLFNLNDSNDLAQQLSRLIDEPALVTRLRAGIAPVKTIEQEMSELLGLYTEIDARRGSS